MWGCFTFPTKLQETKNCSQALGGVFWFKWSVRDQKCSQVLGRMVWERRTSCDRDQPPPAPLRPLNQPSATATKQPTTQPNHQPNHTTKPHNQTTQPNHTTKPHSQTTQPKHTTKQPPNSQPHNQTVLQLNLVCFSPVRQNIQLHSADHLKQPIN